MYVHYVLTYSLKQNFPAFTDNGLFTLPRKGTRTGTVNGTGTIRKNWSRFLSLSWTSVNISVHKKVLLRERKRHTARRVVSTPSVVLTGYPPPCPDLVMGGTLPGYPRQGTPPAGPGRVPPLGVCPMEFWVMLQSIMGYGYPPQVSAPWHSGNVAQHYGIWVPPPPVDRQTDTFQNITFPSYYVR